jgi:hypothetical protein
MFKLQNYLFIRLREIAILDLAIIVKVNQLIEIFWLLNQILILLKLTTFSSKNNPKI